MEDNFTVGLAMLPNALRNAFGALVRHGVVLYYRAMGVRIRGRVFISHRAFIDTCYRGSVTLEDGVFITRGATIIAHDHVAERIRPEDGGRGHVWLGRNVFVGVNAVILRDVSVGENSIIGAGAIVTESVPPNSVVVGNPGRIVRTLNQTASTSCVCVSTE